MKIPISELTAEQLEAAAAMPKKVSRRTLAMTITGAARALEPGERTRKLPNGSTIIALNYTPEQLAEFARANELSVQLLEAALKSA